MYRTADLLKGGGKVVLQNWLSYIRYAILTYRDLEDIPLESEPIGEETSRSRKISGRYLYFMLLKMYF